MFRFLLLLLCSIYINAFAIELQPHPPNRYVVKRGDTLWHIATKFLKNPWDWTEIWHGNPGLANPNYIYPGDVLLLTVVNGKPRIVTAKKLTNHTIKLSPKIHITDHEDAILTIPLHSIRPFLSRSRFISAKQYRNAPYVLALGHQERLSAAAHQQIFVRGLHSPEPRVYSLLRKEDEFRDPKTNDIIGYQGQYIGQVELTTYHDPASFLILKSRSEISIGDRLFPEEPILPPHFLPTAAPKNLHGVIINVEGGITQIGQFSIVAINIGSIKHVAPGYVFAIKKPGRKVIDKFQPEAVSVQLPSRVIGTLMVFKVYRNISYALVMKAKEPMAINDEVAAPLA